MTIDYVNPEAPWPGISQLRDRSADMGHELRPRLPVYPEYFMDEDAYVAASLKAKVEASADPEGYVRGGTQRYAG